MKIFLIISAAVMAALLSSCEFFYSEQEQNGVNPKPFNSQTSWEVNPYNQRFQN